jgi:phage tail-like protein
VPQANRGYTSAKFSLELDTQVQGFLTSVEGGEGFADVVRETAGAATTAGGKHPGPPQFAPIIMTFGLGMGATVFQWITDLLSGKARPKNGAIVFIDFNYKEQSRLAFKNAVITSVKFPALDGTSKEAASITLTIQPESTQRLTDSSGTTAAVITTKSKGWKQSDFRLKIAGLETACARTSSIDEIVVTAAASLGRTDTTPIIDIQNVSFRVANAGVKDFFDWFDAFIVRGDSSQGERSGTLEYLDPSLKSAFFTLSFTNLGIIRVAQERMVSGSEVVAQSRIDCYCERLSFTNAKEVVGSAPVAGTTATPAAPATSGTGTTVSVNPALADSLIGILSGTVRGEAATRAALAIAQSPELAAPSPEAKAQIIARRLLTTVQAANPTPIVPKRAEGTALGESWATGQATLDELQSIAAADTGEWTSLRLDVDNSLIGALRDTGIVAPSENGPIELDRSDFVEGIVAGAAGVLRNATPHLS